MIYDCIPQFIYIFIIKYATHILGEERWGIIGDYKEEEVIYFSSLDCNTVITVTYWHEQYYRHRLDMYLNMPQVSRWRQWQQLGQSQLGMCLVIKSEVSRERPVGSAAVRPPLENWTLFDTRSGVCFLLFYILATDKVISRLTPTCASAHSWWLHGAAALGNTITLSSAWYNLRI